MFLFRSLKEIKIKLDTHLFSPIILQFEEKTKLFTHSVFISLEMGTQSLVHNERLMFALSRYLPHAPSEDRMQRLMVPSSC